MTLPVLSHTTAQFPGSAADAAVLVVAALPESAESLAGYPGLADALAGVGFTGSAGSFTRVYAPEVTSLPFAVVGAGSTPDAAAVRNAAGTALRTLTGFEHVAVALADGLEGFAPAAAEGAVLGGHKFDGYRTEKGKTRAGEITLHAALDDEDVAHAQVIGEAVALIKDLVNVPAEWQSPAQLAQSAADSVADLDVTVEIFDEKALAEQGFGGILGVGQGSDRPPRLVRLDYSPADAVRHIALVGKGITFDTGGLSLKPAASMVGMKFDMAGAATSLAAIRAIAALGLPVHVTAWLCITDNMPSGRALRPGDVIRILDGTTVEVQNTDAEGRLVLADGLVAASRENPDVIIDVATLTGAIVAALGHRHTGVFGDVETVSSFISATAQVDEPAWHMPLPDYMEESLESPIADLQNANMSDRMGGASYAGLFLRRFVGRTSDAEDAPRIPWVHLDIAGSGEHAGAPYGFTEKGPTGAMVRSIVAFAEASHKEA
ncbi:leucyl aminopeptidase [Microbacterium sp. KSW4-16]|uniref:Probable cytosol aminopeptidase n=1 Tax=Microbacterium aurugineum TaxID=2851642 RepID=A0ABY4IXX0_9MICO|nr:MULTISPECIES: leucyl aminopeptidase [Microbacterium]PKQ35749.1 MAG: leucyl aminopeptidase [Actinobacteria bacterium HGW-Actinobacteria-11]MCK8465904.1 leucyl aminopeptidase [Microbacterium aurugineum]MCZ4300942.1 leucyl aminopeptidase [Microbacterium oxydans]TCJ29043.1 leucyl aminopeptidase [Microbacterium sp. PI-1]UPL17610.1 leucyl aminopeptidase [Microbacterium aurugineum]